MNKSLVFVIDVSGSMSGGNRLGIVKKALRLRESELRSSDTVGIVVYGSRGRVVLQPTAVTEADTILDAIDSLQSEGSTNAEEGLVLGYKIAVVAEYAEILRHSYWAKQGSLVAVLAVVQALPAELPNDPDVAEFAQLVARANQLAATP